MTQVEQFVLKTLAIVLVPVVMGLSLYVNILWQESQDAAPNVNPYVSPQEVWSMIDYVKKSTVSINCQGNSASGFAFELQPGAEDDNAVWNFEAPSDSETVVLTNHHVVENCIELQTPLIVNLHSNESVSAEIIAVDQENDVAALMIKKKVSPLYAAYYTFDSGYWVMASGSPLNLQGTVTFGNIINIEGNRIYTSASLNRGNSGGPLVDNEGFVMAINTGYRAVAQNINWAVDINAICNKLATCRNPEHGLIHPTKWEE